MKKTADKQFQNFIDSFFETAIKQQKMYSKIFSGTYLVETSFFL